MRGQERDFPGFDIVGDVHGQLALLEALLTTLGYSLRGGVWRHPVRRMLFLGDLVDRGARSPEVAELVYRMVNEDAARCIMGNHEWNAIGWATASERLPGGYLRPHTEKNFRQHRMFLESVGEGSPRHRHLVRWFRTLPLWHEEAGARFVHACWDPGAMAVLQPKLDSRHAAADEQFFAEASLEGSAAFKAVEVLCKGRELDLPEGFSFIDKDGTPRRRIRVRWWESRAGASYRELALLDASIRSTFPDIPVPAQVFAPFVPEQPTFVGHYWFSPEAPLQPCSSRVACLDFSAGKGGPLVAYRWNDADTELIASRFTAVRGAP